MDWNTRYAEPGYAYGTEPNDFLASVINMIPPGPVVSLGEGEGRNAVFLAGKGFDVTAVDASEVGLAKADRLAAQAGLALHTEVVDLAVYELGDARWGGIVSIFCHLPPTLRRRVHVAVHRALVPGGVLVLEAYGPGQLQCDTGGPKQADMMPDLPTLLRELSGLEIVIARELEREVCEGRYHCGRAAVIQIVARRAG